jgi:hypothetical protein
VQKYVFRQDTEPAARRPGPVPPDEVPQRNHVNPRKERACAHPYGFVSVQFSRNRCRLAADSQSLASSVFCQALFSGAASRVASKEMISIVFWICSLERSGPGTAGAVEDTELSRPCQADISSETEKNAPGPSARPAR